MNGQNPYIKPLLYFLQSPCTLIMPAKEEKRFSVRVFKNKWLSATTRNPRNFVLNERLKAKSKPKSTKTPPINSISFVVPNKIILGDSGAVSRAGLQGATKVFNHGRKSPWVPTLTGPFPNGQANAGSWLGTKNALYYCAQSTNSISWVLFVSSYTTAIDSITACLAHAPKKCTQSGIFQLDINATFQNTGSLNTRA